MGVQVEGAEVTIGGVSSGSVPAIMLSAKLTDDQTGEVYHDFTGSNAIDMLRSWGLMDPEKQRFLADRIKAEYLKLFAGYEV